METPGCLSGSLDKKRRTSIMTFSHSFWAHLRAHQKGYPSTLLHVLSPAWYLEYGEIILSLVYTSDNSINLAHLKVFLELYALNLVNFINFAFFFFQTLTLSVLDNANILIMHMVSIVGP